MKLRLNRKEVDNFPFEGSFKSLLATTAISDNFAIWCRDLRTDYSLSLQFGGQIQEMFLVMQEVLSETRS